MPKGTSTNTKSRKPYAPQACTICRAKKSKCDGVKPVCGSCVASGRNEDCSWGKEAGPRKVRTEAHFEALRKRVDSLQAYVDSMEALLAKCVCQDVTSHLQLRPPQSGVEGEDAQDVSDSEIAQELTVPMQSLKACFAQLDDRTGGLLLHGITAPFRFAPSPVSRVTEVVQDPDALYVLLVDGVNSSESQNVHWSRHLPPEVIMDRAQHDKSVRSFNAKYKSLISLANRVLDLTFKFATMWCLRVVPCLFLRDMHRALSVAPSQRAPRTPHYSPMLHNALLSIAALFSDDPYLRALETRQHFANAAKALLEAECQRPDVSLVNALSFLGTFYIDNGDRIQGELYCGMSSRICMTLGLGVDSTPWVEAGLITRDEQLGRIWVHWSIFSMDVCWALYFGHDFMGSPPDRRTIPLPPVMNAEYDQIPWFHAPAKIPSQPNYLTLIFLKTSALFLIGHKIVVVVNGLVPTRKDAVHVDDQITKIDLELYNWKSALPPELDITPTNRARSTPQRLMMHLQYWWCFLTLHRNFFNRRPQHSDEQIDHVKLCIRAAENILELLETWSSLYSLRLSPVTLLQIVFNAGTICLLRALQATTNQRIAHASLKTALGQAEQCVRYLHEMGQTWPCAVRMGDILHAVLHDKLRPIIERRLTYKGVDITPFLAADSESSSQYVVAAGVDGPDPPTEPAPSSDALNWNPPYDAEADIMDWAQISRDFVAPSNIPAVPGSVSFANDYMHMFPELDTSGFIIPTFDLFGAPDLWGQDLLAGADNFVDLNPNTTSQSM
ncbi:fungal-specific transcription factor domain-containing protein [Mycena filopes]|nr:fungal-specific transcription factor domain-containing protein [Mycena filopes]